MPPEPPPRRPWLRCHYEISALGDCGLNHHAVRPGRVVGRLARSQPNARYDEVPALLAGSGAGSGDSCAHLVARGVGAAFTTSGARRDGSRGTRGASPSSCAHRRHGTQWARQALGARARHRVLLAIQDSASRDAGPHLAVCFEGLSCLGCLGDHRRGWRARRRCLVPSLRNPRRGASAHAAGQPPGLCTAVT